VQRRCLPHYLQLTVAGEEAEAVLDLEVRLVARLLVGCFLPLAKVAREHDQEALKILYHSLPHALAGVAEVHNLAVRQHCCFQNY